MRERAKLSCFCAIDLNQISVTFSQEVDKTSAETIGNYFLDGGALVAGNKAELQADKKTVLINLATAKTQYAQSAFKVNGNMIFGTVSTLTVPTYPHEDLSTGELSKVLDYLKTESETYCSIDNENRIETVFDKTVSLTKGRTRITKDGAYVRGANYYGNLK